MTKNPRDYREWTNREIEEDAAGYLAAQEATNEREKSEKDRRREEFRREEFIARFKNRADGEAEWKRYEREREAEQARTDDAIAERQMHASTLGAV